MLTVGRNWRPLIRLLRPGSLLEGNIISIQGKTTSARHSKTKLYTAKTTKTYLAQNHMAEMMRQQKFDYFLVLDFEATCDNIVKVSPQEIIEFPILKVNGKTFEVDSEFHQYVEPEVHKNLSSFCTELTGIVQDMVDGQPHLTDTLKTVNQWMEKEGLLSDDVKSVFVTCGDWDLKTMLPNQCKYFGIPVPGYFKEWINIKKSYAEVTSRFPRGMMEMIKELRLTHQGRHHSGIDDCRNIANILKALAERGAIFNYNGSRR